MKVKIRMISVQNGEKRLYTCSGREERTDSGDRIEYELDGDVFKLLVENGKVDMERTGECFLSFRFEEGKETRGKIGLSEEQNGEIPVKTHRIQYIKTGQKTELYMEYDLQWIGQNQNTALRLIAVAE